MIATLVSALFLFVDVNIHIRSAVSFGAFYFDVSGRCVDVNDFFLGFTPTYGDHGSNDQRDCKEHREAAVNRIHEVGPVRCD